MVRPWCPVSILMLRRGNVLPSLVRLVQVKVTDLGRANVEPLKKKDVAAVSPCLLGIDECNFQNLGFAITARH